MRIESTVFSGSLVTEAAEVFFDGARPTTEDNEEENFLFWCAARLALRSLRGGGSEQKYRYAEK